MDKQAIIRALRDTTQSASNAIASNVSGPVDLLAAALRGVGMPIPEDAIGGSKWMADRGLTKEVPMGAPRIIGETLGMAGPAVAAAKAPQIAAGFNQMQANAMVPRSLNSQRGVVGAAPNKKPNVVFESVSDSPQKWENLQKKDLSGFENFGGNGNYSIYHKSLAGQGPDMDGFGEVVALGKNNEVIGTTFYGPWGDNQLSKTIEGAIEVAPNYRRQGVGTSMYDAIEKITGKKMQPGSNNTPLAKAFWENRANKGTQ